MGIFNRTPRVVDNSEAAGQRWPDKPRKRGEAIDGLPLDKEIKLLKDIQRSANRPGMSADGDVWARIRELREDGLWPS